MLSFGAIRVPHEFDEKAYNVSRDVFFKHHATGITAPDYCTMFFKNKETVDIAEKELQDAHVRYQRSDFVEYASIEERNFWACNGCFPTKEEIEEYRHDLLRSLNSRKY